jgi:N-acetylglutamate synthase-like GNAT family acetyltransferase
MKQPKCTYTIRPAQIVDQKIIRTLLCDFKLPQDGLYKTKLWVLQLSNGVVAGVAGLELYGKNGLLRSVAVIKNMQNQGYGTTLTSFVIEEAKNGGVMDLFLLTTTAAEFFKKLGFKMENREKIVGGIKDSVEFKSACPKTAVLMRLSLA